MSSQEVFSKEIYHGTVMIYDTDKNIAYYESYVHVLSRSDHQGFFGFVFDSHAIVLWSAGIQAPRAMEVYL